MSQAFRVKPFTKQPQLFNIIRKRRDPWLGHVKIADVLKLVYEVFE